MHVSERSRSGLGLRRGFTLIELLVVVIIIAILISVTLAVGGKVLSGGKTRLTADLIRQTDSAIETYITEVGSNPKPLVEVPSFDPSRAASGEEMIVPLADGVDTTDSDANRTVLNSMGFFIHEAEKQGLTSLFDGVPSEFLVLYDGDVYADESLGTFAGNGRQPELRTVVDAWGRPLRFVHPSFDGLLTEEYVSGGSRNVGDLGGMVAPVEGVGSATEYVLDAGRVPDEYDASVAAEFPIEQIRRNRLWRRAPGESVPDPDDYEALDDAEETAVGDSDGGRCVNDRPYVYSAGEDGDPSTYADPSRDLDGDNVYGDVKPRYVQDRPGGP